MKIISIVGARPQFIKAAPVSQVIKKTGQKEILVHTGQHFDADMSDIFFKELDISKPDYELGINSVSHGAMTGRMLEKIEKILIKEKPDCVFVYGDTNSTLAGALAAAKLHIPIAHIEAGLRSFNREMPEEHNRVLTDHCADILFCPAKRAVDNLKAEGITNTSSSTDHPLVRTVALVGDTMYDAVLRFSEIAQKQSTVLNDLGIKPKGYLLATVHRPYNTDVPENIKSILAALLEIDEPIILPIHPRTKRCLKNLDLNFEDSKVKLISPVGYFDMLALEQNAKVILTDSGGMQKEAYFLKVPCITMRTETEWVETVEAGWNVVVGADKERIVQAVRCFKTDILHPELYGDGRAAEKILDVLQINMGRKV